MGMRLLGVEDLPLSSIDLPVGIAFPLHRRPRLKVVAHGRGLPDASRDPVLTIEVTNAARVPVGITGVYTSFIHTSFFTEVVFGSRTAQLPLHEFDEGPRPPYVLDIDESVTWKANLRQLRGQLEEKQLTLERHSRYLDLSRIDLERWRSRGRLAIVIRNRIATTSHRRSAVVVLDDKGGLHKAKVRWQPPGSRPPRPGSG